MKKPYRVADGVDWVNGARVPKNRIVTLTDAEALYERGLGRIEEKSAGGRKKADSSEDQGEAEA